MQTVIDHKPQALAAPPMVRAMGMRPYLPVWHAMRDFSRQRDSDSSDSFWWLQHQPVYTTGLRERNPPPEVNGIQLVATDRGGLRTCHSPGQLVLYPLLNLRRIGLGASSYVKLLEQAVIAVLSQWGLVAATRVGAPGVYLNNAKIASIGVRLVAGNCYHGLALNISNDLSLFAAIVPCGMENLQLTRMCDYVHDVTVDAVAAMLIDELCQRIYSMEYIYGQN
ncbi:MAG: lipoyl(octanoyl) transferase LipB [Candidatus Porifericomitaceae bacterium WSBS_2022_MAG_OTU9]